jgi:hypothetical protein
VVIATVVVCGDSVSRSVATHVETERATSIAVTVTVAVAITEKVVGHVVHKIAVVAVVAKREPAVVISPAVSVG